MVETDASKRSGLNSALMYALVVTPNAIHLADHLSNPYLTIILSPYRMQSCMQSGRNRRLQTKWPQQRPHVRTRCDAQCYSFGRSPGQSGWQFELALQVSLGINNICYCF